MMNRLKGAVIAAALLLVSASTALADTVTYSYTSPLITGNSWTSGTTLSTQALGSPGSVTFNKAVFTWLSGTSTFEVGGSVQGASKIFQGGAGSGADAFQANDSTMFYTATEGAGSSATTGTVNITGPATNLAYILWLTGAGTTGDTVSYKVDLFQGSTQTALAFVTSSVIADTAQGGTVSTTVVITNNIPVPPAVWTGVAMLGGMMFLVRRRNRKVLA